MKSEKWNQNWNFWQENNSFALVWITPENAKKITLPHDAMIDSPRNEQSTNGGNTGFRDGGVYVYTKTLGLNDLDCHKKFILQFDGVFANAMVYVNGQLAGKNIYGYSTFYVNLSPYLQFDGDNEIRVQVKTGNQPNSRWYSGSGIYRDVYLLTSGLTYIVPEDVQIVTEDISDGIAVMGVHVNIANQTQNNTYDLETAFIDNDGNIVAKETSPIYIANNDTTQLSQRITILNPDLWSAENPNLYHVSLRLLDGDEIVDEHHVDTGIRQIKLDAYHGLRVNGQSVKLQGAGVHHDNGIIGAVELESVEKWRLRKLKEAGFNAIRMAHQPASPALLRAADRVGMYVMDETFDMWQRSKSDYDYSLSFDEHWREDVTLMVKKDFNHPSVLMYSVGNEIPEIATNQGLAICEQIVSLIKSLDSTRYTLAAVNGMYTIGNDILKVVQQVAMDEEKIDIGTDNVNQFMTYMDKYLPKIMRHPSIANQLNKVSARLDITGYNYMGMRYEEDVQSHPNRMIVGSETYPPEIAFNWDKVMKYSQIIGDFTWTGWDYLGEVGVGVPSYKFGDGGFGATYPAQTSYVSDINLIGFRRPMSYYREIVFGERQKPYIAVQNPHHYGEKVTLTPWIMSDTVSTWSWQGVNDQPVVVEVYSAGSTVELFINNRSCGKKAAGKSVDYRTIFELAYEPGELKAISYDNQNNVIGETLLQSAGEASQIDLSANVLDKKDDSHHLVYVDVTLCDENGLVITDQDAYVTAEVSEQATIYAAGTGNPKPLEEYKGNRFRTFNGRGLIVVEQFEGEPAVVLSVNIEDGSLKQKIELPGI